MKKKPPVPDAAPAKSSAPATPQQAPPQAGPSPAAAGPGSDAAGRDFSQVPAQSGPLRQPADDAFRLPAAPLSLIDWSAMRKPFLTRGVALDTAGIGMIETNWMFTYNQMARLGFSPDRAIAIANFGTPIAYDFSLQRDHPTVFEESDRQLEKMMPAGKKIGTITVPLITPDTLGWVTEKVTGKKYDFRF